MNWRKRSSRRKVLSPYLNIGACVDAWCICTCITSYLDPCWGEKRVNFLLFIPGPNIPNGVNGINGHVNGINGHDGGINVHADGVNGHAEPSAQSKPSLRLSFAEYKRISNLLVLHLRRIEDGKRR